VLKHGAVLRLGALAVTRLASQILEKEYYAWCRQQCADVIRVFSKCKEEAGLGMIFKCREEQRVN
jgi:hypothetical protein